ncbi:MAG: Ku protein, partial [Mycobacterium leprae]
LVRSMWKGSISFGLVTIPVKLYAATESRDLKFNLLHAECRTKVEYRKFCPTCDREVAAEEIVKGYEIDRGRYVLLAEEDFEAIPMAAARTLDIVNFIRLEEIDPIYFERTYFLEPGEGGNKAYALLREALEASGRIALARMVMRARESLAAIRVYPGGALAMSTMHFPEEIRTAAGLAIHAPELRPQEVEMAINLVQSLSGEFVPGQYENRYREALLAVIEAKATGETVTQVAQAPPAGRVVDLMEALRASVQLAREGRGEETPAVAPPAPAIAPAPAPAVAAPPIPGLAPAPPVAPIPGVAPAPSVAPIPGVAAIPGVAPVPGIAPAPVVSPAPAPGVLPPPVPAPPVFGTPAPPQ